MTPTAEPVAALIRATIAEERLVTDRALNGLKDQVSEGNIRISKQLDDLSRKLPPLWAQARENERQIKALQETQPPKPANQWQDRIFGSILGALIVGLVAFPGIITASATALAALAGLLVKLKGSPP